MEAIKINLGKVSVTVSKEYWDIDKEYDRLTIVERQSTHTCFLSRKPVPAGISITNREYWIQFSTWQDIPYEIVQEFGNNPELQASAADCSTPEYRLGGLPRDKRQLCSSSGYRIRGL